MKPAILALLLIPLAWFCLRGTDYGSRPVFTTFEGVLLVVGGFGAGYWIRAKAK